MIDKERLLKIKKMNLSEKLEQMDENQFNMYVQALHFFVDSFPVQERNLRSALEAKDHDIISRCLVFIWDMLEKIYAEKLSASCLEQINQLKDLEYDKLEAGVTGFLSEVSSLSIEIQMAEYKEQEEEAGEIVKKTAEEAKEQKEINILAVDDRSFFLGMLKAFLEETGYKLTCVTSGMAALRYLNNHTPDLFILDIEMPEMDGYELAQKIKHQGHKAPIIFLTGNASKECVIKAMQVGAVEFIIKPIDKKQVIEKIANCLG